MKYIIRLIFVFFTLYYCPTNAQSLTAASVQNLADQIVQTIKSQQNTPGIAVAIYYQGQDYFFNYGLTNLNTGAPVTKDTIFELASISKVFTSDLLAINLQQGKLKLNDPITKFLPALRTTHGLPINQVQVVNLATHTASFPRDITEFGVTKFDQGGFMQALTSWQPNYPIGTHYLYSNVGFGLLGKVLEGATGQNFNTLLQTQITSPLAMNNTCIWVSNGQASHQAQGYNQRGLPAPYYVPNFLYGGGALRSTASDLLQYLKANLGALPNTANINQAFALAQNSYFAVKPNFVMALGWQRMTRNNNLFIIKNGMNKGFNTFIGFSPTQKFGVVVLANKRDALATKMGNQLLSQLSNLR